MSGRGFLAAVTLLAVALVALGAVPWGRTGTPWRPDGPRLAAAARHFDAELIEKGRAFRSSGYNRYFLRKGLVGLLLAGLLGFGLHRRLRGVPFSGTIPGAVTAVLALLVLLDLVGIPFGLAALDNSRRFGLSTQSTAFWFADHFKGLGLSLAISAVVLTVLFFLMRRFPSAWPLPATILAGIGGVIMALILPLVVDPLFNTFTPLRDPTLAARFMDVTRRAGVPVREVLVSNASIRTTAVNAYFTGFGPTRRIVVYDTLVETLTPEEGELVLAHEAGHWSKGHITWGLIWGTLGVGVALLLAAGLLGRLFRAGAFGLEGPLDPAAAPLYLLLFWAGTFLALPVENAVSRYMEAEADHVAMEVTGDAATQISVEKALGRKNLSDVVPPPFIEALLYTHPNTLRRIEAAEAYLRKDGAP